MTRAEQTSHTATCDGCGATATDRQGQWPRPLASWRSITFTIERTDTGTHERTDTVDLCGACIRTVVLPGARR